MRKFKADMGNIKVRLEQLFDLARESITKVFVGTWVPLERGKEIAILYKVDDMLDPIVNFRPATESPPLAPKHITAASAKPRPPKNVTKANNTSAPIIKKAPSMFPPPPFVSYESVAADFCEQNPR